MGKRALAVYNPASRGRPSIEQVGRALDWLRGRGWEADLEVTRATGHATELAREAAARGFDALLACGGDGTVNEAANGLTGSITALAVLPGGTANIWAKEARIPRKPLDAVRLLEEAEARAIDLGRASWAGGERYFVLMAGVGFDAAIVRSLSTKLKRRLGAAAYVLSGLRMAIGYRTARAQLQIDGEPCSSGLYWAVVGNTRNYGGLIDITHRARADDGALDLCLLDRGGLLRLAWLLPWLLLGRHDRRAHVLYQRMRSLEAQTPGLPVQVDGEYLGETPMRFEVAPAALQVVVPHGMRSELFSS